MNGRFLQQCLVVLFIASSVGCSKPTGDPATSVNVTSSEAGEPAQPESKPDESGVVNPPDAAPAVEPAVSNEANQAELAAQAEVDMAVPGTLDEGTGVGRQELRITEGVATEHAEAVELPPDKAAAASSPQPALPPFAAIRNDRLAANVPRPAELGGKLGGEPVFPVINRAGHVVISNLDERAHVHFAMKSPPGDWRNESLDPHDTHEFRCGLENCLFWMRTGTKPAVYYRVTSDKRYAIKWDESKGLWDLRLPKQE